MFDLQVTDLSRTFDGIRAVDGVSFRLEPGTITALIGPNGAGKTTVLNLISGFLRTDRGEIFLGEKSLTNLGPDKIARLGIGRTFQNIRLFSQMTAIENVIVSLKHGKGETVWAALLRTPTMKRENAENRVKAAELLTSIGMGAQRDQLAANLSHGQRRLLEMARALALAPNVLLLDEPTAGLSPDMAELAKQRLIELRKAGKTILFIEHDMSVVMDISDRILVLDFGKLIADGTAVEIQRNEAVIAAYLGRRKTFAP